MAIDGGGSLSIITKAVGQPVAHSAQRAAAQRAAPKPPAGGRRLPATGRRHHPTRCPTTHLKKNGGGVHASGAFAAQAHRAPPPSKPWVARKTSRVQPPPRGLANTHLLSLPQWHWGCTNCKLPFLALPEWQGNALPPQQHLLV